MGNNKLGQEPAYPVTDVDFDANGIIKDERHGMSKRFYAACAAIQGILANADYTKSANIPDDFDEYRDRVVGAAYEFADELLKQEEQ